jgi:hypothetical protein
MRVEFVSEVSSRGLLMSVYQVHNYSTNSFHGINFHLEPRLRPCFSFTRLATIDHFPAHTSFPDVSRFAQLQPDISPRYPKIVIQTPFDIYSPHTPYDTNYRY